MRKFRIALMLTGILFTLTAGAFAAWVYIVNAVEHPKYRVIVSDGDFEIRDYPGAVVAEVVATGDRTSAISNGFRPLAAYFFAK